MLENILYNFLGEEKVQGICRGYILFQFCTCVNVLYPPSANMRAIIGNGMLMSAVKSDTHESLAEIQL